MLPAQDMGFGDGIYIGKKGGADVHGGEMFVFLHGLASPSIARVATRSSFVAMLVVARDTRHQLLRLYVSVLALAMRKTEIAFKRRVHGKPPRCCARPGQ